MSEVIEVICDDGCATTRIEVELDRERYEFRDARGPLPFVPGWDWTVELDGDTTRFRASHADAEKMRAAWMR